MHHLLQGLQKQQGIFVCSALQDYPQSSSEGSILKCHKSRRRIKLILGFPSALAGTLVQQCWTYFEACICLQSLFLLHTLYMRGCIHLQCQHSAKYLFHHSVKTVLKSLWQKTEKQRNFIVVDVWLQESEFQSTVMPFHNLDVSFGLGAQPKVSLSS